MKDKRNVGVLGMGAIGSVLASLLIEQSVDDLYFYNRSPRTAIKIITSDQRMVMPVKLEATTEQSPKLDWLLICMKAYHYQGAEKQLQQLISPTTKVAVIRNGLRLKQALLKFTAAAYVLEVMIDCPVQPVEDGFYQLFSPPIITLEKGNLSADFTSLFPPNGLTITQVDDFVTASWKKILESASLGSLLCLSGETCWIFKDTGLTKMYEQLLAEGIAVAKADGAQLSANLIPELLAKMKRYPDTKGSSMLSDRLAGRPIEVGAKNGIIAELGKQYKIATPLHDLISNLLKYTNTKNKI